MSSQANNPRVPRGPVEAEIVFFKDPADGSAPFNYVEEPPEGQPQRNYSDVSHKVQIADIRGQEDQFTLDHDAFQVLQGIPSQTTYETFNSDEAVKQLYYPEVEKLLLEKIPGAHKIIIFDHTIRRADPNASRQPVQRAHGDQTRWSAAQRVRRHVTDPEEAEKLLQGRYRIINVWRPINGAVESFPLAFAKAGSLGDTDFAKIEHRYPHFSGEIMGVRYNPNAEWKYLSGVDDNERLLLKCSDTEEGMAERVPHTAFVDPRTAPDAKARESIEVRTIVFG
ncbi:putative methyltransferase [Aspergillus nomiae NRRL 13137]|uniref:Putative methyltransferase n=1 Tax=Aspergillus nomiae NRRL (strain ATCC 15546 / NRRL 13137 / CBS 260.88 / M93) TaxID=1509407 RepID=A0A0L1J3S6_ASPN3|nr:putative methyltransferase [Aspergillus nomiae NRRL 13137]KNG86409.1 putative methyltransferase [Aspergillus nomiae NRRL 13137]